MAWKPLILTLLLLLPAPAAHGQTVVRLQTSAGLPFTPRQLASAVRLRLQLEEAPGSQQAVRVVVSRAGLTLVVELPDYAVERRLDLHGARGWPAARLVALAILDLVSEEVRLPLPARAASRPRPATRPATRPAATRPALAPPVPPRPAPPPGPPLLLLGLLLQAGAGSNGDRATLGASLEASLRLHSQLRGLLGLGPSLVPPVSLPDRSLLLVALPLRLGLGWFPGRGGLELRAQVTAAPYWVSGEAIRHSGWLGAAGAALFYHFFRASRVRLLVGAGLDLFFNRVELRLRGAPALATERAAFWGGLGVAMRLGR